MKKKLVILALLIQNNDYYILDEPFNGVDLQSNIIITEIIHKLRDLGKTVIISSHIFSTLKETCDNILILKDGTIERSIESDDFDQLESEYKILTLENVIDKLILK